MRSKVGRISFSNLTAEDRGVKTVNKERHGGIRWSVFIADDTRDKKESQIKCDRQTYRQPYILVFSFYLSFLILQCTIASILIYTPSMNRSEVIIYKKGGGGQ